MNDNELGFVSVSDFVFALAIAGASADEVQPGHGTLKN